MKWRLTRWAVPILVGCVFSAPELCNAESPTRAESEPSSEEVHARELAEQAEAAAKAGRPSDAAGLFRAAWRLHKYWDYICNVALLEARLKKHQDAAASLTTCERMMPENLRTSLGAEVGLALKRALQHVASIDIKANVSGAQVFVDGRIADTLPLEQPIFVEPGEREIVARKPGHHDDYRRVKMGVGSHLHLSMTLYPIEVRSLPSAASEQPDTNSPLARARTNEREEREGNGAEGDGKQQTVFVIGSSLGIGAFLIGGGLGIAALVERSDEAERASRLRWEHGYAPCSTTNVPGCKELKETSDRADVLTGLAYGTLAAAGVGAAMAVYAAGWMSPNGKEPAVEAAVAPAPGGGSLVVRGRF